MPIEMRIKGLVIDPLSKMPIVVLEDLGSERVLPIWIGVFEANAIALTMEKVPTPRPMTHDLMKNLLARLDIAVERIVVTDVRNNTFYAAIHCRRGSDAVVFDSRPSDAIALALRTGSPIFVEDDVVRKSHGLKGDETPDTMENMRKWLESISPDVLGKYKM
jgi:bifunctional DNase/RNase